MHIIYYFSAIVNNVELVKERNPWVYSESGRKRTLFIAKAINQPIRIISNANPKNKGVFLKKSERINSKIKIIYVPVVNLLFFLHIFHTLYLIYFIIKNVSDNDKVLIYDAYPYYIYPVMLLHVFKPINIILEIEELHQSHDFGLLKKSIFNIAEKWALKNANSFIITNEFLIKYINRNKPYIVNSGYVEKIINNDIFEENKNDIPIIMYSGRLDYIGGIEIFLDSLQHIRKKCKIIITGVGELEDLVKNYKNSNKVIDYNFLGFIDLKQFENLLISAKICVNPIRTKYLFSKISFPSKMYQYLQYGNIVITSNFVGLKQLKHFRDYLFIYNDDSPRELAYKIDNAISLNHTKKNIVSIMNDKVIENELCIKNFINEQ